MTHAETECWYAVQVFHQHEKKIAKLLEYEGFMQFLPTYKVRHKWSDRVKTIELPLFPGYIFCRSRPSSLGCVLGIQGLCRIVSFGGKPSPIPHEEIAALQTVLQSRRELCSFPYLSVGSRVQVKDGPLAGITGFITQIQNRKKLIISIEVINKSISVGVEPSEVAPVA